MKKVFALIAALLIAAAAYTIGHRAGFSAGITHAIEESVIWTVVIYNPDDPDASSWNGYDQLIYIELDNELYMPGMYQC